MRVIARLDIKNEDVIKGINFEGLRVMGKPNYLAKKYYNEGADELIYSDCVASLYGRNNLAELVQKAAVVAQLVNQNLKNYSFAIIKNSNTNLH